MNDLASKEFLSDLIYQMVAGLGDPKCLKLLEINGGADSALVYLLLQNKATKGEARHALLLWLEYQHRMPTPGDLLMMIKAQRAGELKHLSVTRAA